MIESRKGTKMDEKVYNLPDGGTTEDEEVYDRMWLKFISPLKELTDLRITTFDPDVSLGRQYHNETVITLPVWFVKLINENLEKHDYNIRYMEHCTCGKTEDDGMTKEELGIEEYTPHSCPLDQEVGDGKKECTCCPYCEADCRYAI
jgi:hypothetical protein